MPKRPDMPEPTALEVELSLLPRQGAHVAHPTIKGPRGGARLACGLDWPTYWKEFRRKAPRGHYTVTPGGGLATCPHCIIVLKLLGVPNP